MNTKTQKHKNTKTPEHQITKSPNRQNILVIGSGGREHALVWKISQSKEVNKIYCTPGNAGISQIAECVNISVNDFKALRDFVKQKNIDLTIVGPEQPLANGIVDYFREAGLKIVGPTKSAAQLESSKSYAKLFMKKYNIPTGNFEIFDNCDDAISYLSSFATRNPRPSTSEGPSTVIKADGLCGGKGVTVCDTVDEAKQVVYDLMVKKILGDAGKKVIVEEKLVGEEASLQAFCDGETILPMIPSQDHKRVFDGDLGPNTGGMGAYAPTPVVTDEILQIAKRDIFDNFLYGIKLEKLDFRGIIYAGIMVTSDGPKVLEFNVRFGDPETQTVLTLLKTDIIEIFNAVVDKNLSKIKINWEEKSAVCVVMSCAGYPGKFETGKEIFGLEKLKKTDDVVVFHAGTARINYPEIFIISGGRVLGITGIGQTLQEAINKTYAAVRKVHFDGVHYRKDIGIKGIKKV